MPRQGRSFYIDSHGPNPDAVIRGVQWLCREAKDTGEPALIVVTAKPILASMRGPVLGPLFQQLKKEGVVSSGGVTLHLMTLRKKKWSWDGPALVIYGTQDLLDAVDSLDGACDVLLIPWRRDEASAWISTWGATELGKASDEGDEVVQEGLSKIIRIALVRLTSIINLSTGIMNSSDYDQAVRTFETLIRKGEAPDAELVRQYLVKNGWQPKHAKEVRELVQKLLDGRRPRGSTGRADEGLWNLLQEKLDEE